MPLFGIHYTFFLGLSYHKDYRVELVWLFCDQLFASFQVLMTQMIFSLIWFTYPHSYFIGRLRGFSLLSAERRSQGGNATSVEGSTIKEGGRFLHLRAYKKFEGRNQSKTASIRGRGRHQFCNYNHEKVVGERPGSREI